MLCSVLLRPTVSDNELSPVLSLFAGLSPFFNCYGLEWVGLMGGNWRVLLIKSTNSARGAALRATRMPLAWIHFPAH
jgi:hypothetical protein